VLKRQTLTSQAIDYILNLIKSGKVKPGETLPTEKQLIEMLGISRTCVREAMKSLESLHLVTIRPRIGARVLQPSPAALFSAEHLSVVMHMHHTDNLIEFRKIIELGLVSLAAEKATEGDLDAMRRALDDHKHALETDRPAYSADISFHVAIAEAAKNPIVTMVLNSISGPLAEQRRRTNEVPHAAEAGLRDHYKIFRAIKEHNPKKARESMREHMKTAERFWQLAQTGTFRKPSRSQRISSVSREGEQETVEAPEFSAIPFSKDS
jgi:GntR family transcriptional repressor for pyruvate dehydrogenase complex